MKKGFTLIELIGVIALLGMLSLIAFPIITKSIKSSKERAYQSQINEIIESAKKWGIENTDDLPDISSDEITQVAIETLMKEGYLTKTEDGTLKDPREESKTLEGCIVIKYSNEYNQYEYSYDESCKIIYKDGSGANTPELLNNMIPIKYESDNWVYADIYEEWYDYDNKEWANAVILNSGVTKTVGQTISESEIALWYVWIPRYKYTIFNGNNGSSEVIQINLKFEKRTNTTGTVECENTYDTTGGNSEVCTDINTKVVTNNVSTYTHPAFTFGDKELTGIWVGKFEISGTTDAIKVIPNVSSLRSLNVSTFFTAIQNVSTNYNINADSHMIKNTEWGAVAYLKQSKYGLGTVDIDANWSSSYYTGGGTENYYKTTARQSTTGNVYGVYDMSGGAHEYVMGNVANSSNNFYEASSGFTEVPDNKYFDSYVYGTSTTTHNRGKLGDATKEPLLNFGNTSGGWYSDYVYFAPYSAAWFTRGGAYFDGPYAGIYRMGSADGSAKADSTSRMVLVAE